MDRDPFLAILAISFYAISYTLSSAIGDLAAGSNKVITIDASSEITLTGVLATALIADDFLFT